MGYFIKQSQPATKLYDHVRELVMRIIASLITLFVASLVVYAFYEPILAILRSPLNAPLYYSNPSGSFAFIMKISLMGALAITIPVITYNLIMFVRPAFSRIISKKRIYITSAVSLLLSISGMLFAYYVILPGSLKFFAGFQVSGLSALISADSYLSFVVNIMTTFIIVFQLPLLISFIDIVKPLTPKKLIKQEKWVVLASSAIALLSPFSFDILTMVFIALPIIALYNISILVVLIQHSMIKKSVIIKSTINPELSLSESVMSNISKELKPATIVTVRPTLTVARQIQPQPIMKKKKVYMDMRPVRVQPMTTKQIIKPIQKTIQQNMIKNQVKTFSDIRRSTGMRSRLVLQ